MGIIKTKGIIIAENNTGDYDKMLTMLTPGFGKIGCYAKSARRPTSLLLAGTQFLCFGDYLLYKGSNSYHINSCEPIEVFYKLRNDLDKLNYSTYITKIISDVTDENENSYKVLQLYLNTLYMIAETETNMKFIVAVFKIRLLCILGYTPMLDTKLSPTILQTLEYIIKAPAKKIYSFEIPEDNVKELDKIADKYMYQSLEKVYNFNLIY